MWTREHDKFELERDLQAAGVPAAAVQKPQERVDHDPETARRGLWPTVRHSAMGDVRVDGMPTEFSQTNWQMRRGGPCIGEHTDQVLNELLGLSQDELDQLRTEGVI